MRSNQTKILCVTYLLVVHHSKLPSKDALHQNCMSPTGTCPISQLPLEKRVDELSQTFNEGLLDNQTETSDERSDKEEDTTDVEEQFFNASPTDSSTYITSHEWQT